MRAQKFENPEVEKRILELLRIGQLASTGWIAQQLGCCWSTARIVLLDLARQNKLKMIHTSIGILFAVPDNQEGEEAPAPKPETSPLENPVKEAPHGVT